MSDNREIYQDAMKELNQEYLQVLEKSNRAAYINPVEQLEPKNVLEIEEKEQEILILDQAMKYTSNLALRHDDRTEQEFFVVQIGDYQIWRDDDELVIVDTEADRLVAYSQLSSAIKPLRPKNSSQENLLLNKVIRNYPYLSLEQEESCLSKAEQYFDELSAEKWNSKILLHDEQEFVVKQRYLQAEVQTAQVLAQYLVDQDSLSVQEDGFQITYEPEKQVLTYSLDDSSSSFSVQKSGDNWYPINQSDSEDRERELIDLQQIQERIRQSHLKQQQQQNKVLKHKTRRLSY